MTANIDLKACRWHPCRDWIRAGVIYIGTFGEMAFPIASPGVYRDPSCPGRSFPGSAPGERPFSFTLISGCAYGFSPGWALLASREKNATALCGEMRSAYTGFEDGIWR